MATKKRSERAEKQSGRGRRLVTSPRAATKKIADRDGSVEASAFLRSRVGVLTLGKLLAAIRQGEEETLAVFSRKLGVSVSYLSDVEHGRRVVSVEVAAAWARKLGYSEAQFVRLAVQQALDENGLEHLQVSIAHAS